MYVFNVGLIRQSNMAVIISILFCVGLEVLFQLSLFPNNSKYNDVFLKSSLPIEIFSKDGLMNIKTHYDIELTSHIHDDSKSIKLKINIPVKMISSILNPSMMVMCSNREI